MKMYVKRKSLLFIRVKNCPGKNYIFNVDIKNTRAKYNIRKH